MEIACTAPREKPLLLAMKSLEQVGPKPGLDKNTTCILKLPGELLKIKDVSTVP